jgi:signal peptidase I
MPIEIEEGKIQTLKDKPTTEKDAQKKKKGLLRENVEAILIAIVLALFIRTFIVQAFKIPSGSMKETLQIGDHILVNKFIYGVKLPFTGKTLVPIKDPQRGDIIVFKFPEDPSKDFIKRVIAIGGDTVAVRDKQVFINDQPVYYSQAEYVDSKIWPAVAQPRDNFGPKVVPPNSLFVMGDNRDQSYDSRFWGFVDLKAVKGEAFMIYWSWDNDKFGFSWDRLGKFLECVRWNRIGRLLE